MSNLGRQPLQVVEFDVDFCQKSFGVGLEPEAAPDHSYAQGNIIAAADLDRTDNLFWACDLTFPDTYQDGVIWELGGNAIGAYCGLTSGSLLFRAGAGGSLPRTGAAVVNADPSDYLGKSGTLFGEINVDTNSVALWFLDADGQFYSVGSNTASGVFSTWAGTDDGAVGAVNNSVTVGQSVADWPSTIDTIRFYEVTSFTPSATGCPAVLGTDSERKCFNTYATCPVPGSFSPGTLTLRFSKNQNGLPKGETIFPALRSVSTNPTRITLGAVDERLGSLGKRARVEVNLMDFTYHDRLTDKYQAERVSGAAQASGVGYDPAARGTFFGKLRARWPYYYGRQLRVKNGYVGDDISAMPTRHYIITEWEGPDASGNVRITAQDPLKLADKDLSQCPAPSNGVLSGEIAEGLETFALRPVGVGAEYSASGYASIGSEVVRYTRSGDTVTLTARGVDGTEAASHGEGDTFQQAYHCENSRVYDVVRQLLRDFAGVPDSFLAYAEWKTELDEWLASARLTRTIAKPEAVKDLLGQIADLGIIFWWDEIAQQVRLRPNRPVGLNETVPNLSDDISVIAGSLSTENLDDHRLTQVWFYHGTLSATGDDEDAENYKRSFVAYFREGETENSYRQKRIKKIFMPWLGPNGSDATATAVASRLLNRYKQTPQRISFTADIKDKDDLEVASLVEMQTRVVQDVTGLSDPTQMQVTQSEEVSPGNRLNVVVQTYRYAGRYGYITENTRPDYASSSSAQKAKGIYIVDGSTLEFGDGTGPYLMF